MGTASYDAISTVAEIAGGCRLVAFTTGLGTPAGCAIAPVVKIAGNQDTYTHLNDMVDIDTSAALRGERSMPTLAGELLYCLLEVCNRRPCKAERNKADVMAIDQYCVGF